MVVRDDDLRPVEVGEHVAWDQFAALVIAVRVVRLEDPEAVADSDPGGDDEKPAGEPGAPRPAYGVDGLPCDEHSHDGGLAGARCELQGESRESGVGLIVRPLKLLKEGSALAAELRGDFGEPDDGLGGLDLAEERPDICEPVAAPVLEESRGLRGDAPTVRVRDLAPLIDLASKAVDESHELVLLALGLERDC